jgi:hypothetical protein
MWFDFSALNLAYLIQARDLVIENPDRTGAILGLCDAMVDRLRELTPQRLAALPNIRSPLIGPRQDAVWWSRLLLALDDGHEAELQTLLDHATLCLVAESEDKIR